MAGGGWRVAGGGGRYFLRAQGGPLFAVWDGKPARTYGGTADLR
ncbi:MAG TPA: hypothetical protein VN969_24380 [Streptosporangiaceae bacterium]|nr:hypothetical protein [Streptosporangiaceae bacterium]